MKKKASKGDLLMRLTKIKLVKRLLEAESILSEVNHTEDTDNPYHIADYFKRYSINAATLTQKS